MTRNARRFRCPESVLGWIPWYADGGLTPEQKGLIEAHAAECSDCRAELDIVVGAPFEIDMPLPDPDRLFREITARIDARSREESTPVIPTNQIGRARRLDDDELARVERWVRSESAGDDDATAANVELNETAMSTVVQSLSAARTWFAAAAALAILFLGGVGGAVWSSMGQRSAGSETIYQSATAAPETSLPGSQAVNSGPRLAVVFLDTASVRQVSDALSAVGAEIVSGPSSLGIYQLRLTNVGREGREPTAADLAAVANRLKAPSSAVALFAEAIP